MLLQWRKSEKIISISRHTSRDCLCLIISRQQQFRLITVSQHHVPIIYSSISLSLSLSRRNPFSRRLVRCACGGGVAHFKLLEKILTFAASRALITDYLMSTADGDFSLAPKNFFRFSHHVIGDDCFAHTILVIYSWLEISRGFE